MKADPGEVIGPLTIGDGTAARAAPAALTTRTIAAIDRRIGVPPGRTRGPRRAVEPR